MGLINRHATDGFFNFLLRNPELLLTQWIVETLGKWDATKSPGRGTSCLSFLSWLLPLAETPEPVDKGGKNYKVRVLMRLCQTGSAEKCEAAQSSNRRAEAGWSIRLCPSPASPGKWLPVYDVEQALLCTPQAAGKADSGSDADAGGVVTSGARRSRWPLKSARGCCRRLTTHLTMMLEAEPGGGGRSVPRIRLLGHLVLQLTCKRIR